MDPLLALFILQITAWTVLLAVLRTSLLDPSAIFLGAWILSAGSLASGLIEYEVVFTTTSFLAASAGVNAFLIGTLLARRRRTTMHEAPRGGSRLSAPLAIVLTLIVLGFGFLTVRSAFPSLMSGTFLPENWGDVRGEAYARSTIGIASLRGLALTLAGAAVVVAAVGLPLWIRRNPGLVPLSLISWALLVVMALQSASRFDLAFCIAAALYCWALSRTPLGERAGLKHAYRRLRPATRVMLVVFLVAAFWFSFATFPVIREQLAGDEEQRIQLGHDRAFGPLTTMIVNDLGWTDFGSLAYGLSYFTEPIPKLTFYLETMDIEGWYMMGSYSVPLISQTDAALTGERTSFSEARERIAETSAAHGYAINPWSTSVRDFTIDFGLVGMPIAFLLLGYASRAAFANATQSPSPARLVLASLLAVCSAITAFLTPFIMSQVTLAILLCLVAIGITYVRFWPAQPISS